MDTAPDDSRRKPRVFLSHSREDEEFIQRANGDLRLCQIDPWLDQIEIRHGQPWLEAIFTSGIPTCDCIVVYLTPASIDSQMVKKELDAGLLQKLKDKHIAVLPYISDGALRQTLRVDLQTLQIIEWNQTNYVEVFPRVVAEIWRSYMERNVSVAVNDERVKRLEAELQVKALQQQIGATIFDQSEDKDFGYILTRLDRIETISCHLYRVENGNNVKKTTCNTYGINLLSWIIAFVQAGNLSLSDSELRGFVQDSVWKLLPPTIHLADGWGIFVETKPAVADDLQTFGILEQAPYVEERVGFVLGKVAMQQVTSYHRSFTKKMDRFRYWLAVTEHGRGPAMFEARPGFDWAALKDALKQA
jgi:hypothetical protein